jgi:hypothetical protein
MKNLTQQTQDRFSYMSDLSLIDLHQALAGPF